MFRILVILAMFTANPLIVDDPTPEIPAVEVTEIPTEVPAEITPEPIEMPTEEPVISEPVFEPERILACTDSRALNYYPPSDIAIVIEDGSCVYQTGCTDKRSMNYAGGSGYIIDDGSCAYYSGCTDPDAINYVNFEAYTIDDGSCMYMICSDDMGCDVSYTKPHKAVKKSAPVEEVAPVIIQEELIMPEYIFSLADECPFFQEAIIQEVCRY